MKIAVNARTLYRGNHDGVGRFTFETLKLVVKNHPEHEFILLFDRTYTSEFVFSSNVRPVTIPPPATGPLMWRLWFDYCVPRALDKVGADCFISTDGFLSLKTDVPQHLVIHDLCFVHNPQELSKRRQWYYNKIFNQFPKKATRIATVSEYSRGDISKTYGIDLDKIDVVYNGCSNNLTPLSEAEKTIMKKNYTDGCDFFVFVGSMVQSRKNLPRLLQAFNKFKSCARTDFKLVIVGDNSLLGNEAKLVLAGMEHAMDVRFTGQLHGEDLRDIIGSAFAMTYVPYFEGFGLPILEAMECSVPVITSETTSLPEVGGDAAMYVDPFSIDSIKNAMVFISESEDLRTRLIEKGFTRCKKFTWEKTAAKYWDSVGAAFNIPR